MANTYMGLQYKTKGGSSPQGKPRVYFCASSEDFALHFETLSADIWYENHEIAFWYHDLPIEKQDEEALLEDLGHMQLFVIPVTKGFLKEEGNARVLEFAYAIKQHIPILPILMESGLEEEFNILCGDFQILNRLEQDPTEIPYKQKLKEFLRNVLISDELARRIRAEFEAYIFLSYRKKDRKYAQEVMKLIHSYDFCRDIAIWYDEFLTHGENFNDAIMQALGKSAMLALVVTPSLLETPNYIRDVEYPQAVNLKKLILPIEAFGTDRWKMGRTYRKLPKISQSRDEKQIEKRLQSALKQILLMERGNSPEHIYCMGLAYYYGIDMEVDHEKGLSLLKLAAQGQYPPAYEKLTHIYSIGDGMPRDYEQAVFWYEKYVEYLTQNYLQNPTAQTIQELYAQTLRMAEAQCNANQMTKACATYQNLGKNLIQAHDRYGIQVEYEKAELYYYIAKLMDKAGETTQAVSCYEMAIEEMLQLYEETPSEKVRTMMVRIQDGYGSVCEDEADYPRAESSYEKALEIACKMQEENPSIKLQIEIALLYQRLGRIYERSGKLSKAGAYYAQALDVFEEFAAQREYLVDRGRLAGIYLDLGDLNKSRGKISEARTYYDKALAHRLVILEKRKTLTEEKKVASLYGRIGQLLTEEGASKEALEYLEKAFEIRKNAAKQNPVISYYQAYADSAYDLGKAYLAEKDYQQAFRFLDMALQIWEEMMKRDRNFRTGKDYACGCQGLGELYIEYGNFDAAQRYLLQAYEALKKMEEDYSEKSTRRSIMLVAAALTDLYLKWEEPDRAQEYCMTARNSALEIMESSEDSDDARNAIAMGLKMADVYRAGGNYYEAETEYRILITEYEKILQEKNLVEDRIGLGIVYSHVAELGAMKQDDNLALKYYLKIIELAEPLLEDEKMTQKVLFQLLFQAYYFSAQYMEKADFELAKEYREKAEVMKQRFYDGIPVPEE